MQVIRIKVADGVFFMVQILVENQTKGRYQWFPVCIQLPLKLPKINLRFHKIITEIRKKKR